jgi:hypothetical protein
MEGERGCRCRCLWYRCVCVVQFLLYLNHIYSKSPPPGTGTDLCIRTTNGSPLFYSDDRGLIAMMGSKLAKEERSGIRDVASSNRLALVGHGIRGSNTDFKHCLQ